MGLVLAAGGVLLWYVLVGAVSTIPVLAIAAAAVGVSLLGGRLPGTNGLAIGVVVGGIVGTAWLQVSVARGTPLPPRIYPSELPPVPLPPQELLSLFLGIPAITYGLAGFILGRRVGPTPVLVVGALVAVSTVLLPSSMDRLAIITATVAAPVVVATLAAIGTDARLPSQQAE